jgi:hypothetical protein
MEKISFKEKRAFTRFPIRISLDYLDANSNKTSESETLDISAQGLGIITDEELPSDTYLQIVLKMPDNGEQISRKGKVIWSKKIYPLKYRAGIRLEEPKIKPISLVLRIINYKRKYC